MVKKIVIVHHQPLEMFPPVLNLLRYLSTQLANQFKVFVLTTQSELNFRMLEAGNISITRIYKTNRNNRTLKKVFNFGLFVIRSLFLLLKSRPDSILYYESHSALPVFLYYKYFRGKSKLFIHYHEYMTHAEYSSPGMRLINYSHKKEGLLYTIASWISHTNEKRMELFLKDNPRINKEVCKTLPNYPPLAWAFDIAISNRKTFPVRLVYVGSFGSFETLYIKELLNWVNRSPSFILDIYSFNVTDEVNDFISAMNSKNIQVKGNVDYDLLPSVLKAYTVGIILYKANSLNFQYNAPNKLFEYLAIGLDVWFPEEMLGCLPYVREDVYPKVIKVDFKNLKDFEYQKALNKTSLVKRNNDFFCENIFGPLVNKLAEC